MFFPSLHKSLAEKSESKMSEYHFHREPSENTYFLMHLKQASMSASEIHPSTADFFYTKAMLGDSSPLPKCGSAS